MPKSSVKIAIVTCLLTALFVFFTLDLDGAFSFSTLKERHAYLVYAYQEHPMQTILLFAGCYIAATALSLPVASLMTLAGGALFGLGVGTVVVSFASSVGATCAFLIARFLFRDAIQSRYSNHLRVINAGIEREGALYLLSLRLAAVFPFFVINILMALTPIRTSTFYLVSQIGMIPVTIIFVNAGTQLGRIASPADILSPSLMLSFVLLGLFPLLTRKLFTLFKRRRA